MHYLSNEDEKSDISLLTHSRLEDNRGKKKSPKKIIKLENKILTAKVYNKLPPNQKKVVRRKDFTRSEWRLLKRSDKDDVSLNGMNDPGKAFCCIKMKQQNVHQLYSLTLLSLETIIAILSYEGFEKSIYYKNSNCPNKKFQNEDTCINMCGDNCNYVEKSGIETFDMMIFCLFCFGAINTIIYIYFAFDPYFIKTRKCTTKSKKCINKPIVKCIKLIKKKLFGDDSENIERYIEFDVKSIEDTNFEIK